MSSQLAPEKDLFSQADLKLIITTKGNASAKRTCICRQQALGHSGLFLAAFSSLFPTFQTVPLASSIASIGANTFSVHLASSSQPSLFST